MFKKIRVGIVGYGNLGKGAERGIDKQEDMELVAIFTRRNPEQVIPVNRQTNVLPIAEVGNYIHHIDVMLLCGGSKSDLPKQSLELARMFHTVDSFDIHEQIPQYFKAVDEVARKHEKISITSIGWDPGLFSMYRLLSESILPSSDVHTFWGKGLSQGHSEAVRRVPGVRDGVQYTIPSELAIQHVRLGKKLHMPESERHERVCYVVAKEGGNPAQIEYDIKTMPHYFAPFKTTVHFISAKELNRDHSHMGHGGLVMGSGVTGNNHKQLMEFRLTLKSNPEFTALVLLAYARAAFRLSQKGEVGARTILDIPIGLLSPHSAAELRKRLL